MGLEVVFFPFFFFFRACRETVAENREWSEGERAGCANALNMY